VPELPCESVDRESATSPDQRYDTFVEMDASDNPGATWAIVVPGTVGDVRTYEVRVVLGDADPTNRQVADIVVNGELFEDPEPDPEDYTPGDPSNPSRWTEHVTEVVVDGGTITIGCGPDAVNNVICFVEITAVSEALASVNTDEVFTAEYDYRTRRLSKTEGSDTTTFRYDGGVSFVEYKNGAKDVEFVRGSGMGGGIGSILYSERSGDDREYFVYCPAVGHVVATVTGDDPAAAAAVKSTNLYEAFGNIVMTSGASDNNRLANTKERDAALGLDNHGFRYYDPEIGRYSTRDPIGHLSGTMNVYAYVGNNPVNVVDPLGLGPPKEKEEVTPKKPTVEDARDVVKKMRRIIGEAESVNRELQSNREKLENIRTQRNELSAQIKEAIAAGDTETRDRLIDRAFELDDSCRDVYRQTQKLESSLRGLTRDMTTATHELEYIRMHLAYDTRLPKNSRLRAALDLVGAEASWLAARGTQAFYGAVWLVSYPARITDAPGGPDMLDQIKTGDPRVDVVIEKVKIVRTILAESGDAAGDIADRFGRIARDAEASADSALDVVAGRR
jgi:RHS repeat-associated protein